MTTCGSPVERRGRCYLQTAEADHAVHHLGDTETVAEVVEGVVLVVVMDTQLQRQRDGSELTGRHKRAGGGSLGSPAIASA